MEKNIPASENCAPEENSNQNPNSFYGQNNYGAGSKPRQYSNYPYNAFDQNNGQYNPYPQFSQRPQANFGIYANYYPKNIWSEEPLTSEELRKMQSVSIASICVFVFWLIFLIFVVIFAAATASYVLPLTFTNSSALNSSLNKYLSLNVALTCFETIFGFFWTIGIIFCGVFGSVRAYELSRKSRSFKFIMIFYIIGIFIPIFQLVAACIGLSKIKKY